MDDVTIKPAARIPAAEMERRREVLRRADAHGRIEGLYRTPESQETYDAFVRGEIEIDEILPRIKALHTRR